MFGCGKYVDFPSPRYYIGLHGLRNHAYNSSISGISRRSMELLDFIVVYSGIIEVAMYFIGDNPEYYEIVFTVALCLAQFDLCEI